MLHRLVLIFVYKIVMKGLLSLFFGMRYCSTDKLKGLKQFIIVSNHNSHLDTMTIMSSLPMSVLHTVHPVAAGDYFAKHRFIGLLIMIFVNVVYVYRDKENNLEYLDQHLKAGRNLIIFPEGTRGEPEVMQKFRSGVGVLLHNNPEVLFVPVYIDGVGKMMPRGDGLPIPMLAQYKMGEPQETRGLTVHEINEKILNSIIELKGY